MSKSNVRIKTGQDSVFGFPAGVEGENRKRSFERSRKIFEDDAEKSGGSAFNTCAKSDSSLRIRFTVLVD